MGVHPRRSAGEVGGSIDRPIEEWPFLGQDVPQPSRRSCSTCHWFRHHAAPQCFALLACRCQECADDMVRQKGCVPQVA